MGVGARAARGHTSGRRLTRVCPSLTGARPSGSTDRTFGEARRAHAAALEGTLAALAALPPRAGGAVVRGRAHSTRVNATHARDRQTETDREAHGLSRGRPNWVCVSVWTNGGGDVPAMEAVGGNGVIVIALANNR